mmetsp:Transcript_5318/g.15716  ORF Transcript_5318/g.15716 Transcript_5318/m.15716 type:complete len:215 (+) Transcript_5318:450-1094(+)
MRSVDPSSAFFGRATKPMGWSFLQPLRSSRNRPSAIPDIFDGMLAWTFRQDESRRRRGCDVDRGAAIDGAVCRGLVRRLMALRAALEAWGRRKTRRPVDAHDALDAVRRLRAPLWPVRRLLASYSCTGSKLGAAAPTRSCRRAPSVPSLLRLGALLVSEVRRGSAARRRSGAAPLSSASRRSNPQCKNRATRVARSRRRRGVDADHEERRSAPA